MKKLNRLSAIIALILIAAFILPSTAVIAAANDSNLVYFYGDLNANGEIDKFDYILIKRSCMNTLSLTDEQISRGDVNNNGDIDKFDYILVKRHVMGTFTIPKVTLCEHELESINAKDATCDENGNIAYFYCVKCEKYYSDADAANEITPESTVIAAKGHDYTELKNDENGSWKECACGAKSETTSHTYGEWETVTEPTCTETGVKKRNCTICGYSQTGSIPVVSHTYGEWETVTEPTCTKQGTKKRACVDCGHTETDVIAILPHSYDKTNYNSSTHWKECICGAKSEPSSHTYGEWATVIESTCTEQGTRMHICTVCLYIASEKIPLLDHTYGDWLNDTANHWKECECGNKFGASTHTYGEWETVTEPTCTETGVKKRNCTICEYSQTGSVSVVAHTYGEWKTVTEPTCTNQGTKKRVCVDCGHTETDVIAILPHSYDKTNYNSYTHWKECVCGKKSENASHTYGEWETVTEPTCTETGVKKRYCTICEHSQTGSVSVVAHTYGDWETVTEPTCTEQGTKKRDCVNCGHIETDVIAILPHSYDKTNYNSSTHWKECVCGKTSGAASHTYGEWKTVTEPTCTETGVKKRNCTICGYSQTGSISVVAHTYGEWEKVTEPTCTKQGTKKRACVDCGHTETDVIATLPHSYDKTNYNSSTHWKECVCGKMSETIAHTYTNVVTPPTESEQGFTTHACNVCGHSYKDSYVKPTASVGLAYTVNDDGITCTVTGIGTCKDTKLIIPSKINGYKVTSIGEEAFYPCDKLTSVTIGNGVTSIGDYAFAYCRKLTSVTIGNSVTSIGNYVFGSCDSLKYNVYNNAYYLGNANNPYVVLVKAISKDIKSCTINPNTKFINSYAFYECSALTSITIPDSVTSIGNYAFYTCKNLTSITIPDSVTSIGDSAFSHCTSLTSIIIPDGVTSIGGSAFYYCDNLVSITIPDSVTSFGSFAFFCCDKLKNVTIGNGVTSIGDCAFRYCYDLTSVTIGNSVTSIGNFAFDDCDNLKYVYYAGTQEEWKQIKISSTNSRLTSATIHYKCKFAPNGSMYAINDDGVTCTIIGVGTCSDSDLIIPSEINGYKVTSIGNGAFAYCYDLTSITIPDSVTSIGNSAFYDCSNLTSITIPDSVTSIGNFTFAYCDNLTSIAIPDSVTSIGNYAFYYCKKLTSIIIPDSVTSIGDAAFSHCTSLKDVYYAGSQEEWKQIKIGSYNSDLTSATIHYNSK